MRYQFKKKKKPPIFGPYQILQEEKRREEKCLTYNIFVINLKCQIITNSNFIH